MTDLDTLIRRSDPVPHMTIPEAGSPQAHRIWSQVALGNGRRSPRRPPRRVIALICLATALVVTLVVLQPGPGPLGRGSTSAAAALRQLALVAARQPALHLNKGQYLANRYEASLRASWSMVGSRPTPGATATIGVTIKQWSTLTNLTCTQQAFGAATFDSPAARQAWLGAGLSIQPSPPVTASCIFTDTVPSQDLVGTGAIDVSSLPVDTSTLARELENGTTGIARLDKGLSGADVAFQRAVQVLVEPTIGATPAFWSALLRAMSTFPGVRLLGTEATHTGASGLAFGAQIGPVDIVVVLSPTTGRLLEAQNVVITSFRSISESLRTSFMPFAERHEGGSGGGAFQWLDPIGSPSVEDGLPRGLNVGPLPKTPTATIEATTRAGLTSTQFSALQQSIARLPGVQGISGIETRTPGVFSLVVTLTGSPTELANVERFLRSSSVIASFTPYTS